MTYFSRFSYVIVQQATPVTITVGSHVWVEDADEAWMDGEVLEVAGGEVKISCTSGKTVRTLDLAILALLHLYLSLLSEVWFLSIRP